MLKKYGSDVVNDLEAREKLTKKWTDDEIKDIRDYYKRKLSDLRSGIAPDTRNDPLSLSSLWVDIPLSDSVSVLSMFDSTIHSDT
jgi:hypothetical protein